jgi:hypothetical protein
MRNQNVMIALNACGGKGFAKSASKRAPKSASPQSRGRMNR